MNNQLEQIYKGNLNNFPNLSKIYTEIFLMKYWN